MSGKRIIGGAQDAVAIASGDVPAPRVHMYGHAYVPEAERDRLAAENAKLRDALQYIEEFGPGITHQWAVSVRSIARAALSDN